MKKITKTQSEILALITEQFLTAKQIAQRRQTKIRVVQRHIATLKKRGFLDKKLRQIEKVHFRGGVPI